MIITIDGPAAAGKGTVSSFLAQKYKLAYFDTGMVYRAVGLQMVLSNTDLSDENEAEKVAKELTFPKMIELSKHKDFRSDIGGQAASVVSAHPKVRSALLKMQQNFALNPTFADGTPANGVVYDGRDTGTVVCPNADLKLFITASTEIRAQRRYKEFTEKDISTSYEQVLQDMIARDKRDSSRATAPLKPADDAIIIDTSALDIEKVLQKIIPLVEEKL
ncbi:MAG: (d)CMP kinase [Alphaproteobacteria bacterium]|nr:(d)CMP kinase [Alphaproteobacteria bacterium]